MHSDSHPASACKLHVACKQRLQLIGKHIDRQWLALHQGDATLTANVIAVLEDEIFRSQVDSERARLRAAADAPTDLQAHEPSGSSAPATLRSSPAAAVGTPSSTVSEDMVASALDECAEKLVAACDNLALGMCGISSALPRECARAPRLHGGRPPPHARGGGGRDARLRRGACLVPGARP